MEKKSTIEKNNEFLYHNTELLLKKYRDVVWSIEVSAMQAEVNFEFETGCKMTEFLDMSYAAGADLMNTKIEEQVRTMERNRRMLQLIDRAVEIIRRKHQKGEMMYWVLYYIPVRKAIRKRRSDCGQDCTKAVLRVLADVF